LSPGLFLQPLLLPPEGSKYLPVLTVKKEGVRNARTNQDNADLYYLICRAEARGKAGWKRKACIDRRIFAVYILQLKMQTPPEKIS
jgi:hypothetical protein